MRSPGADRWLDRNVSRITAICVVGTCLCFIGLGYVQTQVRSQASEGQKARDRQEQVFPVSCKIYVDAFKRGVITEGELGVYETPKRCPRSNS